MKVFLFDFDGVITDTLPVAVEVYNQMLVNNNIHFEFTPEKFASLFLNNFHEGVAKILPNKEIREKILKEKNAEYERRKDDFRIFDGIKEAITDLAKAGKMIIISSNGTNFIKVLLESRDINCFDEILGGDIEKSKVKKINWQKEKYPDAEIYYIGDTTGDVKESKESEIIAVAAAWGFHSKEVLAKENPDFLLEKPSDLLNLI